MQDKKNNQNQDSKMQNQDQKFSEQKDQSAPEKSKSDLPVKDDDGDEDENHYDDSIEEE